MDLSKIANNLVRNVANGEMVKLSSFWEKETCIIHFLRRFGWPLCRLGAKELSTLKPQLEKHNVRLIGIGLEDFGLEDFQTGKYWDGELYIDTKKETYKSIGFKRYNVLSILAAVVSAKARAAINKSKEWGIQGNMKGDGFQTGGTLIVSKGGSEVLMNFRQEAPGDHASLVDILKALGIDEPVPSPPPKEGGDASSGATGGEGEKKMVCDEDACQMK